MSSGTTVPPVWSRDTAEGSSQAAGASPHRHCPQRSLGRSFSFLRWPQVKRFPFFCLFVFETGGGEGKRCFETSVVTNPLVRGGAVHIPCCRASPHCWGHPPTATDLSSGLRTTSVHPGYYHPNSRGLLHACLGTERARLGRTLVAGDSILPQAQWLLLASGLEGPHMANSPTTGLQR